MIEKGNMTDAEYIAVLEKEHLRLKSEIKKRDKKIDKLEVENECLRKDNHIFLEALIYTASLRQQKRTGLMCSNTLNCC